MVYYLQVLHGVKSKVSERPPRGKAKEIGDMVTAIYEIKERLQDLLAQVGLSTQTELIAMHLTEIEEEAINFLDQLTVFRAHARHQDSDPAQEALVEISLSLQHVADHIRAVKPILNQGLGIDDD
jgi:N-methylhydantoinase B/oxoprolinase/acetone carboxylase alpha subunit